MQMIRAFVPGEESALLALFQASVRGLAARDYTPAQIEAWSPSAPSLEDIERWSARIRTNRPWVLEQDGCLAAFADLQPSGYIDQFFVAPAFAGQGLATALMRHLHEAAASLGAATLSANVSLTAQPFFRRCGFVIECEQEVVVRGVVLRNAVMRKTLLSPAPRACAASPPSR